MRLGVQIVSRVERRRQLGIDAAAEPASRQRAQAHRLRAFEVNLRRRHGRHRGQGLQRQCIEQLADERYEMPVLLASDRRQPKPGRRSWETPEILYGYAVLQQSPVLDT